MRYKSELNLSGIPEGVLTLQMDGGVPCQNLTLSQVALCGHGSKDTLSQF